MTPGAASFRDPAGRCWVTADRVLRIAPSESAAILEQFLQTPCARRLTAGKQLVSTRRLTAAEAREAEPLASKREPGLNGEAVFTHERIPFRSYAYEWVPEMLWACGELTLELAAAALADGYSLKDATPYNLLFRGTQPVFVDMLSFEPRVPGNPVWPPYGQFVRTFLLPLLANKRWQIPLADIFLNHRDGLEPQQVYPWCGLLERFRPPMLSLVSLPTWLRTKARQEGSELYEPRQLANQEKARFIVSSLLKGLQRSLRAVKPRAVPESSWSGYMENHNYSEPAFGEKEQFVQGMVAEFKPKHVLDLGANTGHFSTLAARAGAEVVAVDSDPACVGALWQRASQSKLTILPLAMDLARPSPALGWRNLECPSFLERAAGRFDCVLMLALVHHLLVTERVPLEQILSLAADLTSCLLIIEFVPREDPMFQQLARGRDHLHLGFTRQSFEQVCTVDFEILQALPLPGTGRILYGLKRKGGGG